MDGKITKPDKSYTVVCAKCRTTKGLAMIPIRNHQLHDLIGWLFSCDACMDSVVGSTVSLNIK